MTQQQRFTFIPNNYSKHLICQLCLHLFTKPTRLHKCAHTFCFNCINETSTNKCPLCLSKIVVKQDDILAAKLVDGLLVKCLSKDCTWKGTLDEFKKFHNENCRLKKGGIDVWLNDVMQSIEGREKSGNKSVQRRKECSPPKQNKREENKVELPIERVDKNEIVQKEEQVMGKYIRKYNLRG